MTTERRTLPTDVSVTECSTFECFRFSYLHHQGSSTGTFTSNIGGVAEVGQVFAHTIKVGRAENNWIVLGKVKHPAFRGTPRCELTFNDETHEGMVQIHAKFKKGVNARWMWAVAEPVIAK